MSVPALALLGTPLPSQVRRSAAAVLTDRPSHSSIAVKGRHGSQALTPSPGLINLIVEIPAGSSNKYEYLEDAGVMALDRVLHSAVRYPFDYGTVSRTPR